MALNGTDAWLTDEWRRLITGAYPRFVYRSPERQADRDYLPVFTFHTLEPERFESQLRFLARNGYETLSLDRALDHLAGRRPIPERSVVLTIDDGRLSTWTVGYPLLKRYGMTATAFVVPGYLATGPARPTRDAFGLDEAPRAVGESEDRRTFLRWSEVAELHSSGIVRIESHTMLHMRVATSPRVVDFLTPEFDGPPFDLPLDPERRSGWTAEELDRRLGAPIFESEPVLATRRALTPPRQLVEECVDTVRSGGGPRFFRRPGWRRRLRRVVGGGVDRAAFAASDTERAQRRELAASRTELERRLPDKRVSHLCLPSGAGSERAMRLARDVGYETVAWGPPDRTRRANRPGSDPYRLERLKHDLIFRLPGRGRWSLARVLCDKAIRRIGGDTGY